MSKKQNKLKAIPEKHIVEMIKTALRVADFESVVSLDNYTFCEVGNKHLKLRNNETNQLITISIDVEKLDNA